MAPRKPKNPSTRAQRTRSSTGTHAASKTSSTTTTPTTGLVRASKASWTSLPPEIRNSIYSLVLGHGQRLKISSPSRKSASASRVATSDFASLLQVNKQTYNDAIGMFYMRNTFIIGNGPTESTEHPNLHALTAFINRVPARLRAFVKKVEIWCYFWEDDARWYQDFDRVWRAEGRRVAKDLRSLSTGLGRTFRGMEDVRLRVFPSARLSQVDGLAPPREASPGAVYGRALVEAMESVLCHASIKEMRLRGFKWVNLHPLAKEIEDKQPVALRPLAVEVQSSDEVYWVFVPDPPRENA